MAQDNNANCVCGNGLLKENSKKRKTPRSRKPLAFLLIIIVVEKAKLAGEAKLWVNPLRKALICA